MVPDRRKIIGSLITCKAIHITHISNCQRRYGDNAKTKILDGTVVEVMVERSSSTNRAQTYIMGDWEMGNGRWKRVKVHIRFVQAKDDNIPAVAAVEAPVAAVVAPSSGEDNTNNDNNQQLVGVNEPPVEVEVPAAVHYPSPVHDATNAHINDANGHIDDVNNNDLGYMVPDTPETAIDLPDITENDNAPVVQETIAALPAIVNVNVEVPLDTCHGRDWYKYPDNIGGSINGTITYREWGL
jgi:hypothetical protein